MSLLTDIQHQKGYDFTLTIDDFPDREKHPEQFMEALKTYVWFFLETFQTVKDVGGRTVPYRLPKQQKYIERQLTDQQKYYNYIHALILKGRQYWISTYIARRGLHFSMFHSHSYMMFANKKEDIAEEGIFEYVWEGLESLKKAAIDHPYLEPLLSTSIARRTGSQLKFNGQSQGKIEAAAATKDSVGRVCQYAHITEGSRIPQLIEFWNAFLKALHLSTFHQCIFESTAFFEGPKYMEMFKASWDIEKKTGQPPPVKAIFIPPYMCDEYINYPIPEDYTWEMFWEGENEDLYGAEREIAGQKWWDDFDKTFIELPLCFMKWRRDQISREETETGTGFTKLDLFKQDYPMTVDEAELLIGDNVFDRRLLDKRRYYPSVIKPLQGKVALNEELQPEWTEQLRGDFQIWSFPEEDLWYTLGLDPSGGTKGDYSVGVIWSPVRNEIAAMFRSNQTNIHQTCENSIALAYYYNNALLAYESNYWGGQILLKMLGKDSYNPKGSPYYNLYTRKPIEFKYNPVQKNPKVGFHTDVQNKPIIVGIYQDLLLDDDAGLYSEDLINELWFWRNRFDKEGNRIKTPAAPKGKYDDIIMALGIAVYVARECVKRVDLMTQMQVPETDPVKAYEQIRKRIRANKAPKRSDDPWNREMRKTFKKMGVRTA